MRKETKHILFLIVLQITLTLIVLFSVNVFAGEIHRTDTELVDKVYATSTSPYNYYVLYSIGGLDLKKGDTVDLRLQAEFTNDCNRYRSNANSMYNIGLGRYIVRASSPDTRYGTIVNKSVVHNITYNMHHGVITHSNIDYITEDMNDVYYNVVVFAMSSEIQCAGHYLEVEGYTSNSYGEFMLEIR